MVPDHWSNDVMVSMDRCDLVVPLAMPIFYDVFLPMTKPNRLSLLTKPHHEGFFHGGFS